MNGAEREIVRDCQRLAAGLPTFFDIQGPSVGDKATATFMRELPTRCAAAFDTDFAQQRICGPNGLTVGYYFPDEGTVGEAALSLRNPASEFERDILKAIMARDAGQRVRRLVFITKPAAQNGGASRARGSIIAWAKRAHDRDQHPRCFAPNLAPRHHLAWMSRVHARG